MAGKTIILDGHSLAHRAYHALPPTLTDPEGRPTNAVLGFCNMLIKLIGQESPERLVCAFDSSGPVFRHEDYADYKATRKHMDQDRREQMPVIKEACRAFGADVVELKGFEADDLIGTMARLLEEAGKDVVIVTSDRDSYQLASDKVTLMITKKGLSEFEMMGPAEVEEACGVSPDLVPDLKGLTGDASDNIPGVKGIGGKTAAKLIRQYGSLENILSALDGMKQDRVAGLLAEGADKALLSKKLAIIDKEAPIEFDPKAAPQEKDDSPLREFLAQKGFKSLLSKLGKPAVKKESPQAELFGSMPPAASFKPMEGQFAEYEVVEAQGKDELFDAVARACKSGFISIDLITEGKGWTAVPRRLIVAGDGKAYDFPVDAEDSLLGGNGLSLREAAGILDPALSDGKVAKYGWDIKTTAVMLGKYGAVRFRSAFDPMLATFLINPLGRTDSPSDLLFKYFRMTMDGASRPHEERLAVAANIPKLKTLMEKELGELGMAGLLAEIDMPLVEVLAEMELNGVKVDVLRLRSISQDMAARLESLEGEIFQIAGEEFNIGSPKQLATVLFDKLGLPAEKKTKTGYSTDADVLEGLMPLSPIVGRILDYRGISKLKSTYVDVLPELSGRHGGRIHTTFNQTVAVTGRLSSSDPNMQNIPARSAEGLEIRSAFEADEGKLIISADYSQIELRLLAHLSGDPVLVESFNLGQDVHTRTASEVFGVPMEAVSREMRNRAKTVNFGLIYGQSEFGLARTLGIAQSEAKEYIDKYFSRYTGVKEYFARAIADARKAGYISTMMGRRRPVPELYSGNFNMRKFGERIVMNAPIQGSAADIIKVAMIRLLERLKVRHKDAKLILQVHDELVLEAPEKEAADVASLVKEVMEKAVVLAVPLIADAGTSTNWKDAK